MKMKRKNHQEWMARLSDYLSDELQEADKLAVEAHLADCEECNQALRELASIVEQAGGLGDIEPPNDLWPGIAAAITTEGEARVIAFPGVGPHRKAAARQRVELSRSGLVAASLALVTFSVSATWWAASRPEETPVQPAVVASGPVVATSDGTALPPAMAGELAVLEDVLASARAVLDPNTVRVLERNLGVIEQAITDSREALAQDPGNTFLAQHLERMYRRKLVYLQDAVHAAALQVPDRPPAPPTPPSTPVTVNRGDRVVLEGVSGTIALSGWDRDQLEVRGTNGNAPLVVRRTGATLQIEPEGARRRRSFDAEIRLPAWVDVEVGGSALDLTVSGVDGAVRIANVSGDVQVRDVGGAVDVRSIRGEVVVVDARGSVRASSQGDDVTLRRVTGPVEAHSGDGDVFLDALQSMSVRAETQDGDIVFSGAIQDGGDYGFYLHDGDVLLELPADVSARVHVSTFDGEFTSDFPVRVESFSAGRQFDFVLGQGSASIEIEVFDGEIRLARGGAGR
jgi:anti-sigma factor RsiW